MAYFSGKAKIKWFQGAVVFACLVFLILLGGSVVFAYQRRSGSTGLDAGEIHQIREKMLQDHLEADLAQRPS